MNIGQLNASADRNAEKNRPRAMSASDPRSNCLSYWFPKLAAAGLPVPLTRIVEMPDAARDFAWKSHVEDEVAPEPSLVERAAWASFLDDIRGAALGVGLPAFIRTGHTSGKHNWKDACFLETTDHVYSHVHNLIEQSEGAGFCGLPYGIWALREMLPTKPFGVCSRWRDMPVCREFRFFVDGPRVECVHPYWPRGALEQGGAPASIDYGELCRMPYGGVLLDALASRAGEAVGGRWSVDILETGRGWFVTDMARAEDSYHWAGCPNDPDLIGYGRSPCE